MPSWKKILQSGSAVHVLNITASGLPSSSQPNIIGYDTASGIFTHFSTSSLVSGGSVIGGSGTTNYITRWVDSTTITTSSIYESSSRIGIGTISPQGPLHIRGVSDDGVTPVIFLDSSNGVDPNEPADIRLASAAVGAAQARGIRIIASSSLSNIPGGAHIAVFNNNSSNFPGWVFVDSGAHNSAKISFRTAVTDGGITERMQIAANGTIIITGSGTTSTTTILNVVNSTPTTRFTILGDGTSAFNTSHLYVSGSGLVGIGTTLPTANLHISGANADNLLQVSSPASASILFVSGSGNVGIGTTSPSNTLQVSGSVLVTNITASELPNSTQPNIIGYDTASGRFTYFPTSSIAGSSGISGTGTENYITRWSSGTTITTSSIYESSSRIGIGVGAVLPSAVLHISGASADSLLQVSSPASASILFVSGSGNVGIGTVTPNATLQIAGTLNNGLNSTSSGIYSHAEGQETQASGSYSHAEGYSTVASGSYSHAEGQETQAIGYASHAEGSGTIASGYASHAEGGGTTADGYYSKAIGNYTHAKAWGQFVMGIYNNTSSISQGNSFIIGDGTLPNAHPLTPPGVRKNLVEIKPRTKISDFFGPVRITRTNETSSISQPTRFQEPDKLRDLNKAGIIYMGFTDLFNTASRGPAPPLAIKVNLPPNSPETNYGALRHPYSTKQASYFNPAYALLKIDNATSTNPSPTLTIGRTTNPYIVINTGIFTDGAVTAQEFRALGSWAISQTSDIRLKKNVEDLDINTALRLVENVKPVTFNWNRPHTNDAFDRINGSFDVGVIAQDVLKNGFDHLVRTAENEKMPEHIGENGEISEKGYEFSVSYVGMIPYHAKVIKYLLDEVKELKSEIKRLRKNGST